MNINNKLFLAMSGTPMKYPYSLAAKIRRFPFHHYMFVTKNGWVLKYWAISTILCLPLFYKFHKMSKYNTLENLFNVILVFIYIRINNFFLLYCRSCSRKCEKMGRTPQRAIFWENASLNYKLKTL